jgi:hypothetical protein
MELHDCSQNKIPFISRQQAMDALRNMQTRKLSSPGISKLNVYKCGPAWHIGHRPNKRNQRRLAKRIKKGQL